jgi:hypothetical protein
VKRAEDSWFGVALSCRKKGDLIDVNPAREAPIYPAMSRALGKNQSSGRAYGAAR